jgi:hypothetical protein
MRLGRRSGQRCETQTSCRDRGVLSKVQHAFSPAEEFPLPFLLNQRRSGPQSVEADCPCGGAAQRRADAAENGLENQLTAFSKRRNIQA